MRQALHILRKDIRYLWLEIAATLLAVGVFVFTAARPASGWNSPLPRTVASFWVTGLLPFAWWFLISRAVHAETLAGDRQFWPTRPYSWRSLLLSKALFVALFVNLPVLAAQAIIVKALGFSPFAELPGLLWSQLLLTGTFILPVAAMAAITATVVQFLVIGLVSFIAVLLLSMRFLIFATALVGGWGPMDWIRAYYGLLLVGCSATVILVWQYARRRTLLVRALAVTAGLVIALGAPFPWTTAFALQSRFSRRAIDGSAFRVGFNAGLPWLTRARVLQDGQVSVHIPLQLTGIPDDLTVRPEGLAATIEGKDGAVWRTEVGQRSNVSLNGQLIALQTTVGGGFYHRVKDQPVRLRGYLYATLYGNRRDSKVPFTNQPKRVPGLGICSASAGGGAPYFLACNSVFRPQRDMVSIQFENTGRDIVNQSPRQPISYSPFPAQFGIDPVTPYVSYSLTKDLLEAVTVLTLEPLAHVRIPLAIDDLRLAVYEGTPK